MYRNRIWMRLWISRAEMIEVTVRSVSALQKGHGPRELTITCREGSSVKELLETVQTLLDDDSRSQLFEAHSSRLAPHMMLMVNGRNIGLLEGEQTVLQNRDKLLIWPLVGGG